MNKCRTCLSETSSSHQLFRLENFTEKLKILTTVDVAQEENSSLYPKTICDICLDTINNFYNFRNKVIESDSILKQQGAPSRNEAVYKQNDSDNEIFYQKEYNSHTSESDPDEDIMQSENSDDYTKGNPKDIIPCKVCGKTVVRRHMGAHLTLHKSCEVKGPRKKSLPVERRMYLRQVLPGKNGYQCNYCEFVTKTRSALTQHRKEHANLRIPNATKIMGERMQTEDGLVYECPVCGDRFRCRNSFYYHKTQRHLPLESLMATCESCGITCRKDNMAAHMQTHDQDSERTCEICGKVSKTLNSFRSHVMIHKKIDTVCPICGKFLHNQAQRRFHMNRHAARARMNKICKFCPKRFTNTSDLRHHENSHTGFKPYPCDICKKSFSTKYSLKTHRRQHTNENPFVCTECPMAFRQRVSMKTHMKRAHNIDLFSKPETEVNVF